MKRVCSPAGAAPAGATLFEYTLNASGDVSPLPQPDVDIAHFLLGRGPYSWLGYNWAGCSDGSGPPSAKGHPYEIPEGIKADYGVPMGPCAGQSASGSSVWTREWTKATVELDCSTLKPTITMK